MYFSSTVLVSFILRNAFCTEIALTLLSALYKVILYRMLHKIWMIDIKIEKMCIEKKQGKKYI